MNSLEFVAGMLSLAGLAAGARAWLRATRALRAGGPWEKLLEGALTLCWLAVVAFYVLAIPGLYSRWIAVALVLTSGTLADRFLSRSATKEEPVSPALSTPAHSPYLWAALPMALVAGARLLKGLVAPPMAWDAMTYHLPKAAFWIQGGSLRLPDLPDAWSSYRWLRSAGDILFSWVMLPTHSDLLLGLFGFAIWLLVLIAAARLARELGAKNDLAWLAGAVCASLPAVFAFMTANYVDNLLLFFTITAVTHLLRFRRTSRWQDAAHSLGGLGLAAATKVTAVPMAVVLAPLVLVPAFRRKRRTGTTALLAGVLLLPCVGYVHTWAATGSPVYPFRAPGLSQLPYHKDLADLLAGNIAPAPPDIQTDKDALIRLFWSPPKGQGHMNLGLGGLTLLFWASVGVVYGLRTRRTRTAVLICVLGVLLTTPLTLTPESVFQRRVAANVWARYLLPVYAPMFLCAVLAPRRPTRFVFAICLLANAFHFLPLGWSPAMIGPATALAVVLAITGMVAALVARFAPWERSPTRALFVVLAVSALYFLSSIRDRSRHEIYRETKPGLGAFDAHTMHQSFALASPLWAALDHGDPQKIAVTVGRQSDGHKQFLYPLLGSRLQNKIIYVPVSERNDELTMAPERRYDYADAELWFKRLDTEQPDVVVGLWPPTPERDWLLGQPDRYEVRVIHPAGAPWVARRKREPSGAFTQ